ncbi:class I SAM-dependent methyltransferase [Methylobacterium sp. A54F]
MLNSLIRRAGRQAGLDVFRASKDAFCWSHTVHDYYPVSPRPRWQPGSRPHAMLRAVLEAERPGYEAFLDDLAAHADLIHGVPHERPAGEPSSPCWNNTWFTALDGAALMTILGSRRPARYLEIGSGQSTCFARRTIDRLGLDTRIVSVDPMPRAEIDHICDRVVRAPLEACDLELFDTLEAGDVLFFDGSHRAFPNSDVTVFFFEVLPRLKPGVIVQIHDIFLPDDYPPEWNARLYNEQYLLAAMMLFGRPPFRVLAPVSYLCADEALGARVRAIFAGRDGRPPIPFHYANDTRKPGASFWFEMTGPG